MSKKTQKQGGKRGPGPLLSLLTLFANEEAAAELFRRIRWINGITCPKHNRKNVTKYYKCGHLQRYVCKDCGITFNDKTGTLLHYRHIEIGSWMLVVWMYMCGPLNGISINYTGWQKSVSILIWIFIQIYYRPADYGQIS